MGLGWRGPTRQLLLQVAVVEQLQVVAAALGGAVDVEEAEVEDDAFAGWRPEEDLAVGVPQPSVLSPQQQATGLHPLHRHVQCGVATLVQKICRK